MSRKALHSALKYRNVLSLISRQTHNIYFLLEKSTCLLQKHPSKVKRHSSRDSHVRVKGRNQEFCSGRASQWRCQISNVSYFAQRSFWCHRSISGTTGYDVKYLLPVSIDKF